VCDCLLGCYSYRNTYRWTTSVRLFVRLLLLQEGSSHRCREIVRLLDIRSIEQRQELSIALKQRPALRIIFKGIHPHSSVLSLSVL